MKRLLMLIILGLITLGTLTGCYVYTTEPPPPPAVIIAPEPPPPPPPPTGAVGPAR
jgi:hypothetical protein